MGRAWVFGRTVAILLGHNGALCVTPTTLQVGPVYSSLDTTVRVR